MNENEQKEQWEFIKLLRLYPEQADALREIAAKYLNHEEGGDKTWEI